MQPPQYNLRCPVAQDQLSMQLQHQDTSTHPHHCDLQKQICKTPKRSLNSKTQSQVKTSAPPRGQFETDPALTRQHRKPSLKRAYFSLHRDPQKFCHQRLQVAKGVVFVGDAQMLFQSGIIGTKRGAHLPSITLEQQPCSAYVCKYIYIFIYLYIYIFIYLYIYIYIYIYLYLFILINIYKYLYIFRYI